MNPRVVKRINRGTATGMVRAARIADRMGVIGMVATIANIPMVRRTALTDVASPTTIALITMSRTITRRDRAYRATTTTDALTLAAWTEIAHTLADYALAYRRRTALQADLSRPAVNPELVAKITGFTIIVREVA